MGMTHYMELMMGSWYLLVLFITRAVKPVPSGGGYKAPKLLCLKLRTIVVSS